MKRDPLDHLASLGFEVEECRRYRWEIVEEVVARKAHPSRPYTSRA